MNYLLLSMFVLITGLIAQDRALARSFVLVIDMSSYDYGKIDIVNYVYQNFAPNSTCLDVGACDGKWYGLLGHYLTMDAVEIFEPNIRRHNLEFKYRRVYNTDIADFMFSWYDLIIFGDVIEHMEVSKAQRVLRDAGIRCRDMIVGVPYLYPQDAIYGNPYEEHIQPDLTPEIFAERYPGLELLWSNDQYGYYHKG